MSLPSNRFPITPLAITVVPTREGFTRLEFGERPFEFANEEAAMYFTIGAMEAVRQQQQVAVVELGDGTRLAAHPDETIYVIPKNGDTLTFNSWPHALSALANMVRNPR